MSGDAARGFVAAGITVEEAGEAMRILAPVMAKVWREMLGQAGLMNHPDLTPERRALLGELRREYGIEPDAAGEGQ